MTPPDVTIVMCTRNRSDMLRRAIDSLLKQQTEDEFTYDIVLVDNGSTDATPAVIKEAQAVASVPCSAVVEHTLGQVYARNRGLRVARGEYIANFDDDQIASPGWLRALYRTAIDRAAVCVGGRLDLLLPDNCSRELAPLVRRLLGESVRWPDVRPYTRKYGPGSGNQLLHRRVFDELGEYDVNYQLRGYDTDLYRRIREAGHTAWFTPKALAWHITPPQRLERGYLKHTALHNGWSFAKRDLAEWGAPKSIGIAGARLAYSMPVAASGLLATVSGRPETALAARCQLWRAQGYARSVLHRVAGRAFPQSGFFSRYEFRDEVVNARAAGVAG